MRSVALIGFPKDSAAEMMASLTAEGCTASRKSSAVDLLPNMVAALVCGDGEDWLRTIGEIREMRPDIALIVVTRSPDQVKWLDALEAGVDDYCCMPLDRQQIRWLLGRDSQIPRSEGACRAFAA